MTANRTSMNNLHKKAWVGTALLLTFVATLVTGILLHLKKHGIIIEPRPLLKIIHWTCGYLMTALALWHYMQFKRMLKGMKKSFGWFWVSTWLVSILLIAVVATGMIKQFSPIKIPHLGLWHYAIGISMSAFALFHLLRAIPALTRTFRTKQPSPTERYQQS